MFLNNYKQLSVDSRLVQAATNVLDVTEIRLFELAHREWFGHAVNEAELEKVYALYWFTGLAPIWVRHYTRHVMTLSDKIGHQVAVVSEAPEGRVFQQLSLGCLALSVLVLMTVI